MHMIRTIATLIAFVILVVYGSPVVPAVQSESSPTSVETVVIPGVGPVPLEEFREVQLRNAGVLATLGTIIAPFVATIVGTLLTNIANGITAAIIATLASGFGLGKNSSKTQSFEVVSGPYNLQIPELDVPHESYALPPYSLNHHPLVIGSGHVPDVFVQLQTHTESTNSGKHKEANGRATT